MAQRFGQAADYSQSFAFLWQQQDRALTYRAEQLEQRTQEDQRARDELMFTKYQEGKISGAAILAYIQKRIRQTGYSKAEQRQWKEALVEYRNNVVDNRATAAYNETGNIHAFIAHWQKRLKSTGRGTPERTEISSMLKQLIDQRDATALQNEAERLEREISAGNKSTKDLIALYKSKLATASPALKAQIRDALANLRKRYKVEQFNEAYRKTMDAYKAGRISPQEAADQLQTTTDKWGIKTIDPNQYNQVMSNITELNGTADPVVVARLEEQLQTGDITAEEYKSAMFELARQIGPYNQEGAINVRTHARTVSEQYELENPSAIGQGGGSGRTSQEVLQGAGAVRFVSQLDNSKYALQNCTFASAAMLAAMMDKSNKFTGADLRAASRDFSGGGTIMDAQNALMRKGVDGTQVRYNNRVEFEKFKNMIKQGAPASLSGYLGAMKDGSIHNAGLRAGHNIVVVKYDPRKGFLVMDPARSSKEQGKFWMKEEDLKTFGWSARPGSFYRYGQALFAPKGTVPTPWNKGKDYSNTPGGRGVNRRDGQRIEGPTRPSGGAGDEAQTAGAGGISFDGDDVPNNAGIENDDKPPVEQAPYEHDTPVEYASIDAPGPNDVAAAIERQVMISQDPELEELLDAGIMAGDPMLATKAMVQKEINDRNQDNADNFAVITSFLDRWDGTDPEEVIEVDTENGTVRVTLDDIQDLNLQVMSDSQGLVLLNDATGNAEGAAAAVKMLQGAVIIGQTVATIEYTTARTTLWNTTQGEILRHVANGDPDAAQESLLQGIEAMLDLNAEYQPAEGEADADQSGHVTEVEQAQHDAANLPSNITLADEAEVTSQEDVAKFNEVLTTLQGVLSGEQYMPLEQLAPLIDEFAYTAGIDMPTNWADGDLKGGSPDGIGLAIMAQNAHDAGRVNSGQAAWVHINGQIYAIGYDQDTLRFDESGNVVVGDVTAGGTMDGQQAEVDYSAGAQPQLDMDELAAATGEQAELDESFEFDKSILSSANNIEIIPVLDPKTGKMTEQLHVPRKENYGGIKFMQVDNAEGFSQMLKGMTGLDIDASQFTDGYVDSNVLSQIANSPGGPAFLREVIDAELAHDEPFMANVTTIDGVEQWQDPVTKNWHDYALPWGGGVIPGADSTANSGYTGAMVDDEDGLGTRLPTPDVPWASNEEAGKAKPVPTGQDLDPEEAEAWLQSQIDQGRITPPAVRRGVDGTPERLDPTDPDSSGWWFDRKFVTESEDHANLINMANKFWQGREADREIARVGEETAGAGLGGQALQDTMQQGFDLGNLETMLTQLVAKGGTQEQEDWARTVGTNIATGYRPPAPPSIDFARETLQTNLDIPKVEIPEMPTTSAPGVNPGGVEGFTYNAELGYQKVEPYRIPEPEPVQKPTPTPVSSPGGGVNRIR